MTEDRPRTIWEALGIAHGRIGAMEKKEVQTYQAFLIDDVFARIGPIFADLGITMIPSIRNVEYVQGTNPSGKTFTDARVLIDYTFRVPGDDEAATMTFAAEGRDYGDKATNKAVQQAVKYGLIQMFQISTGEPDPDSIDPSKAPEITEKDAKKILVEAVAGDVEAAASAWKAVIDRAPDLTPRATLAAALRSMVIQTIPPAGSTTEEEKE